mmetsp:Transcript_8075/g.18032  ORF Transcript_8075/g.18032 Transcript_8075/m.18032 type:complete len:386 (-) Transcript_8075:602-1759(-)
MISSTQSTFAKSLAMAVVAYAYCIQSTDAFSTVFGRVTSSITCHASSDETTSYSSDTTDAITIIDDVTASPEVAFSSTTSQNPFLPLLSKGLRRTSIAMEKCTSDQVFQSSLPLQRLRQQIQQLTKVGTSSLGDHVGLGLFASKNIKAGTVVGLYPSHALGYELLLPVPSEDEGDEPQLQDLSMFLAGNEQDEEYFQQRPHGNSPYLHATDQPLFQRPSLLSSLFDEGKDETPPPLYLDVNPNRNEELDGAWTSHFINDGASLLDAKSEGRPVSEEDIEQYYFQSTKAKNCIHIPFGPSPVLATVTTKKVKKGEELFTSYGVVYWLGAVDLTPEEEAKTAATPAMSDKIRVQIMDSAKDLQKAMRGARATYENEMKDLEISFGEL